jgi:hypothetical protein
MVRTKVVLAFVFLLIIFRSYSQENILFIGNSLTYYNEMPTLFQNIAIAKGKDVNVQYYAPGGTGFVNHVYDNNVYDLFASQVWDVVILQPGTGESAGVSWPTDTTILRGWMLMDSIRFYSPCAKILLYEISNGIASDGVGGGNYPQYFSTQTKILDSITSISNGMQIPFAPAGECFRHHYQNSPDLLLHPSYGDVHPNLNGSYLVACSMFNSIYMENVYPCSFTSTIDVTTAEYFQNISDNVVLTNPTAWNFDVFDLMVDFSFLANGMEIQFENLSANFDSVMWNFDGEYFTNQISPSYTFSSHGTKTIELTAYRYGCAESVIKEIEIISSSKPTNKDFNFSLYPNPAQEYLIIESAHNYQTMLSISDILGQIVISEQNLLDDYVDISSLPPGTYFAIIKSDNITSRYKFVKSE